MNVVRQVVVQVGEGDFVLCPDRLTDDDLVDVVELIPVFISAGETQESRQIIKHLFYSCILDMLFGVKHWYHSVNYKKHVLKAKWRKKSNKSENICHIYEHACDVYAKWPPQAPTSNSVKSVSLSFIKIRRLLLEIDVPNQWLKLRSPRNGHI